MTKVNNIQSSGVPRIVEETSPNAIRSQPPIIPANHRRRRVWIWLTVLLLASAAVYVSYRLWKWHAKAQSEETATNLTQSRRTTAIPVMAQRAVRGTLPIYLDGVGTAQALNTVTIHSRVDGELINVFFSEGQSVQKGDVIALIDPRAFEVQVSEAEAQQVKDQAALDNAKRDYARYETAKDAVPRQQLDTAQSLVTQFEAAVKIDQSAIDNAKLQLSYTKIQAPVSGRVGLRTIDAGNLVHASDPNGLVVITQVQPISVVFTLAQEALPQVQAAMKVQPHVPVLAYDTTLTKSIAKGVLTALDNQIDIASGTFKIKALFDNQDNALFPNQFVNIRLLADTRQNVILVPTEAVQWSPQSAFVDVIKSDNSVDQRNIKPGPAEAGMTVVEEGVEEGEMVATGGLDRLEPGTKVAIQSSTNARSGSSLSQASTQAGKPAGRGARKTEERNNP